MRGKRVLARLALLFIAILLTLLLFLAFTGAPKEQLLAIFFLLMVVPVMIYIFIWFTDILKK